ncbi:calexcitin-2 [Ischnura elegans]|uniref:calexcitin-2 n=1 Tax=Ischnura elegans TaxID=197161 RepID=UPI001ED87A84|nr:calexcitin-2 [Ischnura elegans]
MPISAFRKKKLLYVFNVFFDVNQSGTIEKKDFELAIERICRMRGWSPGTAKHQETRELLLKVWDGLRHRADANRDGQVSHEEWCSMWDEYARDTDRALEWQHSYMNFMFDLEDTSGDGCIDEEEFTTVCSSYGISPEECSVAFRKFSGGKSKEVSREAFEELWKDYFASEDPDAPGNFIFGKTSFN